MARSKTKQSNLWHSRWFLIGKGMFDLALAYIFGALAIDTGSYWYYLLSLVFFVIGIKLLIRSIKPHGKN